MDEIMVSVVMMCYNHEPFIRKAIESVLRQKTDFAYEIIIHDDASTDKSAEIIQEYKEKYPEKIVPIIQTVNLYSQNISAKRRYIDPIIRGKYVALCECDDYWIDDCKLQKQVDFLEKHQEYVGCCHNVSIVDDKDREFAYNYGVYKKCCEHRYTLFDLAAGEYFPGQTASLIYRKDAFIMDNKQKEKDYYLIRTRSGDLMRNMLLLTIGDIFYMSKIMSAHRVVKEKGDSWSARMKGVNNAYENYARAIDMRRFVRRYCDKIYWNYYSELRAICKAIILYAKQPTPKNKKVFIHILDNEHNIVFLFLHMCGLFIASIPTVLYRQTLQRRFLTEP